MRTEYAFTLPRGYVDPEGAVHREGTMRLATARDEIEPLRDPAVRRNDGYVTVLLLSRVITRLGPLTTVSPEVVEGLYASDFDHLQRLYERVNTDGVSIGLVSCPDCGHEFRVDISDVEDEPPGG